MTQPLTRRSALRLMTAPPAALALSGLPGRALAQDRTIRLIVPYPPGGPLDVMARVLAEAAREKLGTIVVDNRPGAGGNIGADACAKAAPDGRTLVMGAVATHAINPWLYAHLPYDPIRDFTPLTGVARVPNVLVMETDNATRLGIHSTADLVKYAKGHPGRLNYGSGGNGSAGHLAGEAFKSAAGLFIVHIPYAGGNAAQLALLSGQVDLNFDNLAAASANVRSGKLKALAVTTQKRSALVPDVPAIAETGGALAGFDIDTWFGLFGPAGLPAETTTRLNAAFVAALNSTPVKERLAALMAEGIPSSPGSFAAFVANERLKYRDIVHNSGAHAD